LKQWTTCAVRKFFNQGITKDISGSKLSLKIGSKCCAKYTPAKLANFYTLVYCVRKLVTIKKYLFTQASSSTSGLVIEKIAGQSKKFLRLYGQQRKVVKVKLLTCTDGQEKLVI
jgi:hypothetical protein